MPKFYAERPLNIDGRQYNRGDLVITAHPIPGLKAEIDTQPEAPRVKQYQPNAFFNAPNPVITIIVTFSYQAEFVRDCMEAFRRQETTHPYRIVAVVDQDNEDGTMEILAKYPRQEVIRVMLGNAAAARTSGLQAVTSRRHDEFVGFFDGDDIPGPHYIKQLTAALLRDQMVDFAYARFQHDSYDREKGEVPRCNVYEWNDSVMQYSNITNTPILMRCSALEKISDSGLELWDYRLPIMQDFGMNVILARAGLEGVHVREELWKYRQTEKSAWAQPNVSHKKSQARQILAKPPYEVKTFEPGFEPSPVTFVSLVSRSQVLDEYFAQIPALGIPQEAHWLIFVDSDSRDLIERVKKLSHEYRDLFRSLRIYVTNEPNMVDSKSFYYRGMRIARHIRSIVGMLSDQFLGTPYLFMVEDDTLAPKGAFPKLWNIMEKRRAAYASGVETGRGSTLHTGVCTLSESAGEIVQRDIPLPKKKGIDKIGGGGWYCWIGKVSALKNINFRCDEDRMLGPDVFMVHDLAQRGQGCFVDWSVACQHYDPKGGRWIKASEGRSYEIRYKKLPNGRVERDMRQIGK